MCVHVYMYMGGGRVAVVGFIYRAGGLPMCLLFTGEEYNIVDEARSILRAQWLVFFFVRASGQVNSFSLSLSHT